MADIVDEMLTTTDAAPTLRRLLKAQQYEYGEAKEKRSEPSLLPVQEMRRTIVGSLVNLLAENLPAEEEKLPDQLKRAGDWVLKLIVESIRAAEKATTDYLQDALKNSMALTEALKERK